MVGKMAEMTRRKFLIALLALLLLGCSLSQVRFRTEPQTCEADYYRGVYTLCMVLNAKMAENGSANLIDCDKMVEEAIERGWYEREAPGFKWPIDQDVSGTSARR